MTIEEKSRFIREDLFLVLANLSEESKPAWGKMNAQQMLEHVNDFFEVSVEKIVFPLCIPSEHLPKYREFLHSDLPFRENTKAPASVLGEEPLALRTSSVNQALSQLQTTVDTFFLYFTNAPKKQTMHPVFGLLTFPEWILLHHKHVMHHLRQFHLTA